MAPLLHTAAIITGQKHNGLPYYIGRP